jgi:di/tricarboxylate transporter
LSRCWWATIKTIVATLTTVSILEAAILGVALLLATRSLQVQRMYKAINWTVIFLLAATLPLGTAMEATGLAERVASWVGVESAQHGPRFALALIYVITMVLTELLSNAGTAVLMVPIALSTAQVLQVSDRPFLIAVTFAASCGFMTPIGYQTNAMVYAPGNYRYLDFLRAGAPLNLVFWLLATLLIPYFWPF